LCASDYEKKPENIKELDIFDEPIIQDLKKKYNKTEAQILLNWHLK